MGALVKAMVSKLISGGQSGVDRAALDFAVERNIAYGGWCPHGGWAEDFPAPPGLLAKYPRLSQTPSADTRQRTEWNVRDAEASLIIATAPGASVSKGVEFTIACAEVLGKPHLLIDLTNLEQSALEVNWLQAMAPLATLNVAGSRQSESPGIYTKALQFLACIWSF